MGNFRKTGSEQRDVSFLETTGMGYGRGSLCFVSSRARSADSEVIKTQYSIGESESR